MVEYLVAKGVDINEKNKNKWTALHLAASNGKKDMVEYLIAKGADIHAKNNEQWTALHFAV